MALNRRAENGRVKSPTSLEPLVSWIVHHIAEGKRIVLDHFDEMILQNQQLQGLPLKDDAIALLPKQVAHGSKRESGYAMEKILARKELEGP